MWFAGPQLVDICVSGLAEALAALYSNAGLRKMVSCGGLRPRAFSSPPRSLGSCQAKVFPFPDWLQRCAASWRGRVSVWEGFRTVCDGRYCWCCCCCSGVLIVDMCRNSSACQNMCHIISCYEISTSSLWCAALVCCLPVWLNIFLWTFLSCQANIWPRYTSC